jgi:hypothetical protein
LERADRRTRRRPGAWLVATAGAVLALSGCGLAPSTPPDHAATVRAAVHVFLLGCAAQSAPQVLSQLNAPARQTFAAAGDTLGGCQAVLPLDAGGAPTEELFGKAAVARVDVHGDRADAVVRAASGDVARAELESSPPGEWRLRPSFADRAVVRGTVGRFLDACADADGASAVALLTDAAEERFLAAGGVRDGCKRILPLAPPAKHRKRHDEADRTLFATTRVRDVSIRGDRARATLITPDGTTARAALRRAEARTQWRIAESAARAGGG